MMNLISNKIFRFYILFIFLCGLSSITNAQENIFSDAEVYLQNEDYANAAIEYERIIYNGAGTNDINTALFQKVYCYKQLEEYAKAIQSLDRIRLFQLSPEQRLDYYYEKILCNYLDGNFAEASTVIDEMYLVFKEPQNIYSTLFLQILVYNELTEWRKAEEKTKMWIETSFSEEDRDTLSKYVEDLYKKIPKLKKEKLGKVLSFFPGLEHIYAGYIGEGLVSFTLNAAILTFGVYQAWHAYYITAYIGGAGLLSATYLGSMKRGDYLVKKRNYKKIREYNDKLKNALLDI